MEPLTGSDWTVEQLEAAVAAFAEMSVRMGRNECVTRRQYYRDLARRYNRHPSAFKRSFYQIAGVLNKLGLGNIPGVTSTTFVGMETEGVIRQAILRTPYFAGGIANFLPIVLPPPPPSNAKPASYTESVTRKVRDPDVVTWVLAAAAGRCENCGQPAPFLRANGTPYLEVHHVKLLAHDGSDWMTNAVALCPNCHREFHYGSNAAQLAVDIIEKVSRLVAE